MQLTRFALLPIGVLAAFFLSALISVLTAKYFGIWEEVFAGFFTAFSVVIASYLISPRYKRRLAIACFTIGVLVSGFMLQGSLYPSFHALAGQVTLLPLIATYSGGLAAVLLCCLYHLKSSKMKD